MAKITLEKDEVFEHFHSDVSKTILLDGKAELVIGSTTMNLEMDRPVVVPANTSHTIKNCGATPAVINCLH